MFSFDVIVWNDRNNIVRCELIAARSETDARQAMLDRMSRREAKQFDVITARR